MIVELLAADKEQAERILKGCEHYNLPAKYNRRTAPYVKVVVMNETDVVNIFWLGDNVSQPKINTGLTMSLY